MVYTTYKEQEPLRFLRLLDSTVIQLKNESKVNPDQYIGLSSKDLEERVYEAMKKNAISTCFEGTIELISGQRFPDIIANRFFGVEVKSTKQDHWTTIGNSVREGTRVEGVDRIYLLFGKLAGNIDFRYKAYEECLSQVVVSHSPRYMIDMELLEGATIFDKIELSYDELRLSKNPIEPIKRYLKTTLKPGEDLWWIDEDYAKPNGVVIRLWNNMTQYEKKTYILKIMAIFPEIFSDEKEKFNRVAVWLVKSENVVCPNLRDAFTAGGKKRINLGGVPNNLVSQIIYRLHENILDVFKILKTIDKDTLANYWEEDVIDPIPQWIVNVTSEVCDTTMKHLLFVFLNQKFVQFSKSDLRYGKQ